MIKAKLVTHHLEFKKPAGTSRGILFHKPTWYIVLQHAISQSLGIGECSIIPGLSIDNTSEIEGVLKDIINRINSGEKPEISEFVDFPAIQFALETAYEDLAFERDFSPYPGLFAFGEKHIPINGLIWMGDKNDMLTQIQTKLDAGFTCLKMKIGAIDFQSELAILKTIRSKFSSKEIALRVDANGAFTPEDAASKLEQLSKFELHSIEQPIQQDQWNHMAVLCANSPIPIALDEELIGIADSGDQQQMLDFIRPQYIILKPSLIGGIQASNTWIKTAEQKNIGWWATSALESNVGLNAIAQWTSTLSTTLPQGLGTGQLFTNNIHSPLTIKDGELFTQTSKKWDLKTFR